jgi:ribose-phosphate pyrophosphokinase
VCREGEAFSLQVFGDLLNAQNYASVTFFDVHSPVALAAVRRSRALDNHTFVRAALRGKRDYILITPDLGAAKKMHGVAEALGYQGRPVQCDKYRAPGGDVDHIDIPLKDFGGKEAVIVDDICDGGATFTTLATLLKARNAGRVSLVVSHGIFSKGLEVLREGGVDHVYTTDSFKSHEPTAFLTEIKLCTILT